MPHLLVCGPHKPCPVGKVRRIRPGYEGCGPGIRYGLAVEQVHESAADTLVRRGDVIVAIDGKKFTSRAGFRSLLAKHRAGDTVALLVRRGDDSLFVALDVQPASSG